MSSRRWGEASLCHCEGGVFPPEAISRWMDCFVAKCTPRNDIKRATGRQTSPCFFVFGGFCIRKQNQPAVKSEAGARWLPTL